MPSGDVEAQADSVGQRDPVTKDWDTRAESWRRVAKVESGGQRTDATLV